MFPPNYNPNPTCLSPSPAASKIRYAVRSSVIFQPSPRKCPSRVVAILTLPVPKHIDALVSTSIIMPLDISVGSVVRAAGNKGLKRRKSTWTSRAPTHHEFVMAGKRNSDEHDGCLGCPRRKKVGATLLSVDSSRNEFVFMPFYFRIYDDALAEMIGLHIIQNSPAKLALNSTFKSSLRQAITGGCVQSCAIMTIEDRLKIGFSFSEVLPVASAHPQKRTIRGSPAVLTLLMLMPWRDGR